MTLSPKVDYANGTRYISMKKLKSWLVIQTRVERQEHDEFESRNLCGFFV